MATYDPSRADVRYTLSNRNRTITKGVTDSWDSVMGLPSFSSGKWFWEVTCGVTLGQTSIGIGSALADYGADYAGGVDGESWGYYAVSGNKLHDNAGAGYGDAYLEGDVVGVALDMDNDKVWFAKNGTWQNSGDPAAGTGEAFVIDKTPISPMDSLNQVTYSATVNYGDSPYYGTIPAGFSSVLTMSLGRGFFGYLARRR